MHDGPGALRRRVFAWQGARWGRGEQVEAGRGQGLEEPQEDQPERRRPRPRQTHRHHVGLAPPRWAQQPQPRRRHAGRHDEQGGVGQAQDGIAINTADNPSGRMPHCW